MNKLTMIVPVSLLLAGAAFAQTPTHMTPAEAIAAAAAAPERGAKGVVEFTVQSVGDGQTRRGSVVYLNSEVDSREPTDLSVEVMAQTAKALEASVGGALKEKLVGKRIVVTGTITQNRVDVRGPDHKKTGKYYFETRIEVKGMDQIVVQP